MSSPADDATPLLSRPTNAPVGPGPRPWQQRLFMVIFGHGTRTGKAFDLVLLVLIVISVLAVMLESVERYQTEWLGTFIAVEWVITILFTAELAARLACVDRPLRYVFSFFGIVDIISILPSYLELFFTGAHTLATIRTLRLLRVFRLLKLARHVREGRTLLLALRETWPRVTVFLAVLFCSIVIFGTVMYIVEGEANSGFDDIPTAVYWAIVTMTTVGYGDIAPATAVGKTIAAVIMLSGYAIIIVPIGIFSAQVVTSHARSDRHAERAAEQTALRKCEACGSAGHAPSARFCKDCGCRLPDTAQ